MKRIMHYSQNSNLSTEIILGIIGPIGCNRELVIESIKNLVKHFSYQVEVINVSDIIKSHSEVDVDESDQYSRVMKLMDAGNKLRVRAEDNSILAKMSAIEVSKRRKNYDDARVVYVINSLKHPEEIGALRDTYGNGFYLFAVHSCEEQRDGFLKKYCHIDNDANRKKLIARDKDEELGYGQSTSSAFHLADFFLAEEGDNKKVWNSLERYFDLIFGDPFRTPTYSRIFYVYGPCCFY